MTYTGHEEQKTKAQKALSGAQALANFKSKLIVAYDENAPDAIPKNDPYYLEMLKRTNDHQKKLRISRSSNGRTSLFNHPLLKFYHERKASQKKESLDEANYKLKLFQLIKWDRIKQMKKEVDEKMSKIRMNRQKYKLYIVMVMLKQYLKHISSVYNRGKDSSRWVNRSKVLSWKMLRKSRILWMKRSKMRRGRDEILLRHALTYCGSTRLVTKQWQEAKQTVCQMMSQLFLAN